MIHANCGGRLEVKRGYWGNGTFHVESRRGWNRVEIGRCEKCGLVGHLATRVTDDDS